ncbi:MAG TPA: UDP-glucose 4-epimerase GalE [Syntrophomonas sp.]|nr:UDP-glucose 4-epimerase GalE [Syntrophomonas sp.]
MAIMVTGGAGYIGSHTVATLLGKGKEVVVVDNLIKGHKEAVLGGRLCIGDIRDAAFMDEVFERNEIEAVIHFAADIEVALSMKEPLTFYRNNVYTVICMLESMRKHGVKHIVFSSTAAVYGFPKVAPIPEDSEKIPINPYGETKLVVEEMLRWCGEAYGIKSVALRYFNAAGAHPSGKIGEDHNPESHLVPVVLQAALWERESVSVFGSDYDTPDGTCVRDYVHVTDLAEAHILALEYLKHGGDSDSFNLGNGNGFSVMEIIRKAREVTGREIRAVVSERRAGDPTRLVADSSKARSVLGWQPQNEDLGKIIESAWVWHKNHLGGY